VVKTEGETAHRGGGEGAAGSQSDPARSEEGPVVRVELTDEELVVATRLGSLAAFAELVRRFRPAVRLTLRRYEEETDAVEDLCQEAFLRGFKALAQLDDPGRFGAWLHAIARNLALQQRRSGARRWERSSFLDLILLEGQLSSAPGPAELAERDEGHRMVRQAVEALPPPYREVVLLHYWEGMPLSRVAAYLGLPLTTAKWRLRHARQLLQRELERHGIECL
jgi:RNA polymerase sigma-70 factor, ECF subfamily